MIPTPSPNHSNASTDQGRWPNLLATACVLAVAFVGLLVALQHIFQIPKLDDEIDEVTILGTWFASHLGSYLFQWQMTSYPPQSPIFGNGFLPPYLFGVAIAALHGVAAPFTAARLLDFFLYVIAGLMVGRFLWYRTGKLIALSATATYWCLPVAIYGAATAYAEPFLTVLFLAILMLIDTDVSSLKWQNILLAGSVLGIGLLTKLSIVVPWFFVGAYMAFRALKTGFFRMQIISLILVPPVVAWIIWPGAREISELRGIWSFLFSVRTNMGLLPEVTRAYNLQSYATMLIATFPPILLLITVPLFLWLALRRSWNTRVLLIFGFIAVYLGFLGYFVQGSTRHQIIPLQPFLVIAIALIFSDALRTFSQEQLLDNRRTVKLIGAVLMASSALLTTLRLPASAIGLYVSKPARAVGLQRYFLSGSGELERRGADWIAAHGSRPYHICNLAEDIDMMTNSPQIGFVKPAFTDDEVADLLQRRCGYLVLYNSYFKGDGSLVSLLRGARAVHEVHGNGASLLIYRVSKSQRLLPIDRSNSPIYRRRPGVEVKRRGRAFSAVFNISGVAFRAETARILTQPLDERPSAFHVSFYARTSGCSSVVVDVAPSASPGNWLPGSYSRVFEHSGCHPSSERISEYISPGSGGSPGVAIRVGSDNNFGKFAKLKLTDLRLWTVGVHF